MSPLIHFLVSAIICILLFPIYGWNVLFILIGGVLIDVDHYLSYIYVFKGINFFKAFNYYKWAGKNKKYKRYSLLCAFHSIEFLLVLVILSFFSTAALLITIGVLIHYVLDIIFQLSYLKEIIMAPSILYWIKNNRKRLFESFPKKE